MKRSMCRHFLQRQEEGHKFEVSLIYVVSLSKVRISKKPRKKRRRRRRMLNTSSTTCWPSGGFSYLVTITPVPVAWGFLTSDWKGAAESTLDGFLYIVGTHGFNHQTGPLGMLSMTPWGAAPSCTPASRVYPVPRNRHVSLQFLSFAVSRGTWADTENKPAQH